jgi:hypothetical protein
MAHRCDITSISCPDTPPLSIQSTSGLGLHLCTTTHTGCCLTCCQPAQPAPACPSCAPHSLSGKGSSATHAQHIITRATDCCRAVMTALPHGPAAAFVKPQQTGRWLLQPSRHIRLPASSLSSSSSAACWWPRCVASRSTKRVKGSHAGCVLQLLLMVAGPGSL